MNNYRDHLYTPHGVNESMLLAATPAILGASVPIIYGLGKYHEREMAKLDLERQKAGLKTPVYKNKTEEDFYDRFKKNLRRQHEIQDMIGERIRKKTKDYHDHMYKSKSKR